MDADRANSEKAKEILTIIFDSIMEQVKDYVFVLAEVYPAPFV